VIIKTKDSPMIILELGIEINLKMVERSDKQPKTADIVMSSISNM